MIGQVILGKYRVTRLLDQGGMSKIYLARQQDPSRDVVVKVLLEQHLAQSKAREHFQREIYITSRFQHPHAVGFVDSGTREVGGPALVMEYLRGVDLNTQLARQGRFAPDRTGRLLAQLCDVLQAAHDAGIVHRDLKPGNVMLLYPGTPQETVKLMDFGLAKMSNLLYISPEELVDFNLPPAAGTPEYISPEMVRGCETGPRGDLYSVGVMLFEMLTGRRPFLSPHVDDLLVAHLRQKPPTFAEVGLADALPPGIEELVRDCLAKDPESRPASALELAQRYERALGRRINVRRTGVARSVAAKTTIPSNVPPPAVRSPSTPAPGGHGGLSQSFEANMPEAMALVKLKGFIFDLGGEVVESVPGMIRVRLAEPEPKPASGLFGWLGGRPRTAAPPATEIELHMERRDPAQPGRLTITLVVRPGVRQAAPEWQVRCRKFGMELQAYLMGR